MVHARGIARFGILAVGLGIGAAVAHSPVALADTDFQISFDGMDLFPTTGNDATAITVTGEYGLAIAYGDGAYAYGGGGTGDFALASGTDAYAAAGSGITSGNNYDSAIDIGNNSGVNDGAFAGVGCLVLGGACASGVTDSHDTAIDIGNNGGTNSGAFAGNGDLFGSGTDGNGDTAYSFGNTDGTFDGAAAVDGNNNYASMSGDQTNSYDYSYAGVGNNNSAIDDTSASNYETEVLSYGGNGNYAYVYGPDNSTALAGGPGGGNDNIAYVDDPYGTAGNPDSAVAGNGFNTDLAEVLFTHGNAVANTADYAYDIISPLGPEAGTAAATGGASWLSELLALF
jgi:hypothetical protein